MELRFYEDPETGMPHIFGHGVTEDEARQILDRPVESLKLEDEKRMALGKTFGGRHLCVIYVPDPEPNSVFVITRVRDARQIPQGFQAPSKKERIMNKFPPRLG